MKRTVAKTFEIDFHHDKSKWKDDIAFIISHISKEMMTKNKIPSTL